MIYLNQDQEKFLINYMIEHPDLFIASGASRVVFICTTEIVDFLHLSGQNKYVMKIALGKGGIAQTKNEFEIYNQYKDSGILAEIIAIGRYIEIMEAVEVWDFRDEAGCGYAISELIFENNADYLTEKEAEDIAATIETLHDLFGCTGDNGQLGRNNRGMWVAFDYGFILEDGVQNQTSDISDYIEDDHYREQYMLGLLDLLEKEEDFMSVWERAFLGTKYEDNDDNQNSNTYSTNDTTCWEYTEKDSSSTSKILTKAQA